MESELQGWKETQMKLALRSVQNQMFHQWTTQLPELKSKVLIFGIQLTGTLDRSLHCHHHWPDLISSNLKRAQYFSTVIYLKCLCLTSLVLNSFSFKMNFWQFSPFSIDLKFKMCLKPLESSESRQQKRARESTENKPSSYLPWL